MVRFMRRNILRISDVLHIYFKLIQCGGFRTRNLGGGGPVNGLLNPRGVSAWTLYVS